MDRPPGDRLESWKDIAAYLNRGVRTVRRWEVEEGLPVHRHMHRALGSIFAYKSEIDAWRRARPESRTPQATVETTRDRAAPDLTVSIAVLPFANLSVDPDNAYFADGLTEEIIADLAQVRMLRVISRTSSMVFRHTTKDVKSIARELGVRYILQGSVRRAGRRLRIGAQLIDATQDDHLWAEHYDGTVDDVFAMQERLARLIVGALQLRLTEDEERRLIARPIRDLHAYECYLRARHEAWRWQREAIDHAIRLLLNGLEMVGDNATLYAALGHAYLQYREAGVDFSERPLQEAERCAQRLAALEPGSAADLRLRGWIQYARGSIQDAVHNLKTAAAVDPNDVDTLLLLCNCYLISGKVPAARPLIDRLLILDPLTPLTRCVPGFAAASAGQLDAAVEPYRQMFAMDPGNPMARLFYVWVLVMNGRPDTVDTVLQGLSAAERDTVPAQVAQFLADALVHGRHAVAPAAPGVEAVACTSDVFARFLAEAYAMAGVPDRAFHWLDIAIARGYINYPFLARYDPCLQSLRGDARFERLLDTVQARWLAFET